VLSFVPPARLKLAVVRRYSEGPPAARLAARAALAFIQILKGERGGVCEQAESMGRGCFRRLAAGGCLIAKGIGPSPRSENLRLKLDRALHQRGGGGCVRLHNGTPYPLLVKFQPAGGVWDVSDPRPEGFSMFIDLVRDAEAAHLAAQLGVRAVVPLLLLRDHVTAPWEPTPAGFEAFLRRQLAAALAEHPFGVRDGAPPPDALRFRALGYHHLDGGTLIRWARSAFRLSDLQKAAAAADAGSLTALVVELAYAMGADPGSDARTLGLHVAAGLARTAASLFSVCGVHGQLGLHFQNLTLAGELADFDGAVFPHPARHLASVPLPALEGSDAHDRYLGRLQECEESWRLGLTSELITGYRRAGISHHETDEARLASALLFEVCAMHQHALRAADLIERSREADGSSGSALTRPGTVLDVSLMRQLRDRFVQVFVDAVAERGAAPLLAWSLERGQSRLVADHLTLAGTLTLFGWTAPEVPVDHLAVLCDAQQEARARWEAADLVGALARSSSGRLLDDQHRYKSL
jgi:hypothetical protein